jgi:transcription elongation factor Elf1
MTGEDEAMIFPAIEELRDKLSTWLCPFCGSKLGTEDVKNLKRGEIISCRFCDTTIVH